MLQKIKIGLVYLHCFISLSVKAQQYDDYTQNLIIKAQTFLLQKDYSNASKILKQGLNKAKDKESVYFELGKIAMLQFDFAAAVKYYGTLMKISPNNYNKFGLYFVDALIKNNELDAAQINFKKIKFSETWTDAKKEEYNKLKLQLDAHHLLNTKSDFDAQLQLLLGDINDEKSAIFPFVDAHAHQLFFTLKEGTISSIVMAEYIDTTKSWTQTQPVAIAGLNSGLGEEALFFSFDNKYLLFNRCQLSAEKNQIAGGCDLVMAYKKDTTWKIIYPFVEEVNTPAFEGMPCLNADNNIIYFSSNRAGGFGGLDIWKTEWVNQKWTKPENLGPTINTAGDEITPFLAADGKTLYFSSDKHIGLGGQDIFVSHLEHNNWSQPTNLGAPYNSVFDDSGLHLKRSLDKAYFSSNRPGGKGDFDIYECVLPIQFLPQSVQYFQGKIIDFESGIPIQNASIKIYSEEQKLIKEINSNAGDGSYFYVLPYGENYTVCVSRWDYPEMKFYLDNKLYKENTTFNQNFDLVFWSLLKKWKEQGVDNNSDVEVVKNENTATGEAMVSQDDESNTKRPIRINYRLIWTDSLHLENIPNVEEK